MARSLQLEDRYTVLVKVNVVASDATEAHQLVVDVLEDGIFKQKEAYVYEYEVEEVEPAEVM